MKKKQITLILLCACLVIISVVYFVVVAPLIGGDDTSQTEPPETIDGEGIYLNTICLYPVIDTSSLVSIEIKNEKSEFAFIRTWNKDSGKYEMKLEGHENLTYDDTAYAYLIAYVCTPSSVDNEPIRDLTDEGMRQFGVTEDMCLATYKITYEDENGELKSHTVRLGEKAASSTVTYYVALEGRNSVYRMLDGVEQSLLLSIEEYVSPKIYGKFGNSSDALLNTEEILVYTSKGEPIWQVTAQEKTSETSVEFKLNYPGNAVADSTYLLDIVGDLFCGFSGDATVCVNVNDETRKQYGLGIDDTVYILRAEFSDDQYVSLAMSEPIDGYRYIVSDYYGPDSQIIVSVPEENCTFLNTDDASLLKLAATNTVQSGYYKYIEANEEAGESGVKSIAIRALINGVMFEDKFNLTFENVNDLTVTSESGKYIFIDNNDVAAKKDINQFRNFYLYLLKYPISVRFNKNTSDEISEIRDEKNLLFELTVELNDGELLRYCYYNIENNAGYAMRETFVGTASEGLGNGEIVFDVSVEQINKIVSALKKLINGEEVSTDTM